MARKSLKKLEAERTALASMLKKIVIKKEDSPNTEKLKPTNWEERKRSIVAKMHELVEPPISSLSKTA